MPMSLVETVALYEAAEVSSGSDDAPLVPDVTLELHIHSYSFPREESCGGESA